MDVVKQILVGSSAFFSMYDDFKSKDKDYVCLMNGYDFKSKSMRVNIDGDDLMLFPKEADKEYFMEDLFTSNVMMKVGKFIVLEFAEAFSLTIQDLIKLKPFFEKIDDKHKYEKIIFDSYLENGSFTLTDKQRYKAYEAYKIARS